MSKQAKLDLYRVRKARPVEDLHVVFEFMRESFQFLPDFERQLDWLKQTSFASPEAFASAYLQENARMFLVVEEVASNQVVACVGGVGINPFELELVRLFVCEAHRSSGLGKLLIGSVESFALENGFERVVLHSGYESAQSMYLKNGYVRCGKYFFYKVVGRRNKVQHLAVLGGVHGNELIGIHLIHQYWNTHHPLRAGEFCKVQTVVCNPEAQKQCVRFVDKDLNRCFALEDLSNPESCSFAHTKEMQRAWELNTIIGPKQAIPGSIRPWREANPAAVDYVVDMHSTTSNMGISLITLKGNAMTLQLAQYVRNELVDQRCPVEFHLLVDSDCQREVNNNIDSVPPSGLCIEVGPLAHGTLNNAVLLEWTRKSVELSLEFVDLFNSDKAPKPLEGEVIEGFELVHPVYFPKDPETGCVSAVLHPKVVGRDFCELKTGEALFLTIATNEVVTYDGAHGAQVFPCFVGEAAYFTSGIACWLCRSRTFPVYG
ncbi:hypothetical protein BASA81_007291 [Batrachochytrium salamandrivorans]|nr:hypothetical protein BASA81_007291 [Batrachochytrium salamandrivorans]